MKKFSSYKGFTLVELMIVIAIIGILAAVLYPGFAGFMEGARDSARTASLKNYSTALLAYNQDNNFYPMTKAEHTTAPDANTSAEAMCINDLYDKHLKKYMTKGIEKDQKSGNGVNIQGGLQCNTATAGGFGYIPVKTGTENEASGNAYILLAKVEKWSNANLNITKPKTGTDSGNITDIAVEDLNLLSKGSTELKELEKTQANAYYAVRN